MHDFTPDLPCRFHAVSSASITGGTNTFMAQNGPTTSASTTILQKSLARHVLLEAASKGARVGSLAVTSSVPHLGSTRLSSELCYII